MIGAFHPHLVRQLDERISGLVDELLVPACDRGRLDVVADLAMPLTVTVICELLGIPPGDRAEIGPRATDLGRAFGTLVSIPERQAADEAVAWLRNYVGALIDARRRRPGEDLLSRIALAEDGDMGLSRDEIVDNVVFLFFAGFETTSSLIGNGCALLLSHPAELTRLRADPFLVPTAVEEFLRYDPPIQGVARMVLAPVEVSGRTIRAGRVLVLLLASANRDGRRFTHPEQLDVARTPNPHLSFGGGGHHCLGAILARSEAVAAFRGLLRHFRTIEPAGEMVRQRTSRLRTYAQIPIAVNPA